MADAMIPATPANQQTGPVPVSTFDKYKKYAPYILIFLAIAILVGYFVGKKYGVGYGVTAGIGTGIGLPVIILLVLFSKMGIDWSNPFGKK